MDPYAKGLKREKRKTPYRAEGGDPFGESDVSLSAMGGMRGGKARSENTGSKKRLSQYGGKRGTCFSWELENMSTGAGKQRGILS